MRGLHKNSGVILSARPIEAAAQKILEVNASPGSKAAAAEKFFKNKIKRSAQIKNRKDPFYKGQNKGIALIDLLVIISRIR